MPEQWFVRVEGKEYGPVDLDTLLEWKGEGRLIATNEVRRGLNDEWTLAGAEAELFPSGVPPPLPLLASQLTRARTLREIMHDSFRVYARGFLPLFGLALLTALPTLALQFSLLQVDSRPQELLSFNNRIASAAAILLLLLLMLSWPAFIAGLQFGVADILAGKRVRFGDLLGRAIAVWRRVAKLCVWVYGAFIFWTGLPLIAVLLVAANQSCIAVLIAAAALALQIYMAGRLFVNFMFWQQSCTLGDLDGVEALRDSRELARSRADAPRLERPLYRGAIIASLCLVVLIAVSMLAELPFLLVRLRGVANPEEVIALMQTLARNPPVDALTIASHVLSSVAHALVRPLLGIAFVLLYFDARARL